MPSTIPLAEFSTCEISDALVKVGQPHGGHIPDIFMVSPSPNGPTRICGPAYTVRMVLKSDTASPSLSSHFVDTAPEGSVIVVEAPHQAKNAVWGGLMTAGAKARGCLGVVISGRCRDVAEHRAAGFPVFSRGHSTIGQSPFTRPSAVNVALAIHAPGVDPADAGAFPAMHIEPGDWMVADEDGVVCVPAYLLDKVVELAVRGREIDGKCMADIQAGQGVQETFKKHRG